MSDRAKIRNMRVSGNDRQQQLEVAKAIKIAREMALLPYTNRVASGAVAVVVVVAMAAVTAAAMEVVTAARVVTAIVVRPATKAPTARSRAPRPTLPMTTTPPRGERGLIMQVILRNDIDGLGKRGDIVDVADGHARNFLLPKGKAMKASAGAIDQAARMRKSRDLRDASDREAATTIASTLVPKVISDQRQGVTTASSSGRSTTPRSSPPWPSRRASSSIAR